MLFSVLQFYCLVEILLKKSNQLDIKDKECMSLLDQTTDLNNLKVFNVQRIGMKSGKDLNIILANIFQKY